MNRTWNETADKCQCGHIKHDHKGWYYMCYECNPFVNYPAFCQTFRLDNLWYLEQLYDQKTNR